MAVDPVRFTARKSLIFITFITLGITRWIAGAASLQKPLSN
jgi:hypothetical protein